MPNGCQDTFTGPDCPAQNYTSGAELQNCNLTGTDLSLTDLSIADLTGAILDGADLSDANLDGTNLTGVSAIGTTFTGADFDYADIYDADFTDADLTNASVTHSTFDPENPYGQTHRHLEQHHLPQRPHSDALAERLPGHLHRPRLPRPELRLRRQAPELQPHRHRPLPPRPLRSPTSTGAILDDADLSDANLDGTDLTGVSAIGATFTGANCRLRRHHLRRLHRRRPHQRVDRRFVGPREPVRPVRGHLGEHHLPQRAQQRHPPQRLRRHLRAGSSGRGRRPPRWPGRDGSRRAERRRPGPFGPGLA